MILTIRKSLHKQRKDTCLCPIGDEFRIFVSSFKKGYYLYTEDAKQVGQIVFDSGVATITAADSSSMQIYAQGNGLVARTKVASAEEVHDVQVKETQRTKSSEYLILGDIKGYNYKIYQSEGRKTAVVAAVIPDISDSGNYRVKLGDTGNILKLLMVVISVDRLIEGG